MNGEQKEEVVRLKLQQPGADQRAFAEVEGRARLCTGQPGSFRLAPVLGKTTQVGDRHFQHHLRRNYLDWDPILY